MNLEEGSLSAECNSGVNAINIVGKPHYDA